MKRLHSILAGVAAGAVSAFCFAFIHRLLISDIWFSLPALLVAGAICGLCIGWTYDALFPQPSVATWLKYNALYDGMFALLGGASVLMFEPVITLEEVMTYDALPGFLIRLELPVVIVSTLLMTAIIGRLYARTWLQVGGILVTCAVLVLLLGLNVSAMGLIAIPRSSLYLVLELAGLILALNIAFVAVFMGLRWNSFFGRAKRSGPDVEKPGAEAHKPLRI
ncbi:MAG: hypothetical protein M1281_20560 [Chloroflexi bacterium]|nr:hypothetical protein [Chloroflexota bacterium]